MLSRWPLTKGSIAKRLNVVSGPRFEPIDYTLQEDALKLNVNESAFAIRHRIATSRKSIEKKINRRLVQQVYDLFLDDERFVSPNSYFSGMFRYESETPLLSEIQIPLPPTLSVLGVYTTNDCGIETEVPASTYYVTKARNPCRIRLNPGCFWPPHRGGEGIRVRFACGYAVPFSIATDNSGTILATNHPYQNGDQVQFTSQDGTLPAPLDPSSQYFVNGLSETGFLIVDINDDLVVPSSEWQGIGFLGEVPPPLVEAMVLVSGLNQGGEVASRIPGTSSRLSPIELPVDPWELISEFVVPVL